MLDKTICRIHCAGYWSPAHVRVNFSNHDHVLPGDLPGRARESWDQRLRQFPQFFNGALCRLDGYDADAGSLTLGLSRTCYRDLLFCNDYVQEIVAGFGDQALVRALGISIIIETADHFLPLMQRSHSLGEGAGLIDVFGGHVHPDDHARNGVPDVFHAMADELHTELNVVAERGSGILCIGLLENWQTRKPELIFETRIEQTLDELRRTSQHAKEGEEYTDILSVRAEAGEVETALLEMRTRLTPIGHGSLILLGKLRSWW